MAREDDDRELDQPSGEAGMLASDAVTTGNPYHLSRGTRLLLRLVALVLVISMTGLFVTTIVRW